MLNHYDYLIVGAGLFGCVCAERLTKAGFSVLVIEKADHVGGTCYTENIEGINVHKFGAHIFRTNSKEVFDYIQQFAEFNNFINSPIGIRDGKAYNLPFNMNTFAQVWGITTPKQAQDIIEAERKQYGVANPSNLEEQAISLAGKTIFEMFIKDYTEKQWGRKCSELPKDIIRRVPLRFIYDNNYYNARYQGIPVGGYTQIFIKMLAASDVVLNVQYNDDQEGWNSKADKIIYTGPIDEFFGYRFGPLEYRGLRFEEKIFDEPNVQGNAVLNYNDWSVPYTRSIEHKHFEFGNQPKSIVSYEYPTNWKIGDYPFYPVNDEKNDNLYKKYVDLANANQNIILGGRLGLYKYFDMQDTIKEALSLSKCLVEAI